MYDWWVLQLDKLSVSRKLMVGFGVLLALLLLVVISSNRTLTHQTALSEQLAEVASLMEQTQQAEQGRLAFEAGSDPRQAEQVRQTLAGMLQRLQALRDSELDPAALAHQTEAIEAYRKAFDDLAAADQQRSAARGVLVGTAQQALDSFARLEELMDASLAQQAGDPQALQRSRAVADLHQQLLMVRYQVRGYVFERSDKAEQAAFAAFDALRYGKADVMVAARPPRRCVASCPARPMRRWNRPWVASRAIVAGSSSSVPASSARARRSKRCKAAPRIWPGPAGPSPKPVANCARAPPAATAPASG